MPDFAAREQNVDIEADPKVVDLFAETDSEEEKDQEVVAGEAMEADDDCCHVEQEDNMSANSTQFPLSEHQMEEDEQKEGGRSFCDYSTIMGGMNDDLPESLPDFCPKSDLEPQISAGTFAPQPSSTSHKSAMSP